MVDWAKAAMERLARAEEAVRAAESGLSAQDETAQSRYAAAMRELERARRFLNRVKSENEIVEEGAGLFG